MKVLIVGGGGREHALAWKASRSHGVETVYVAPGNAGTAREPRVRNVDIPATDAAALEKFAASERIGLTIIGPEAPLVAGVVDRFQDAGLRCFGPRRAASALEGSKKFCKEFLDRHSIPTARFRSFTDARAAADYVRAEGVPIVIKADGLAAGKGVVVARSLEEALEAIAESLSRDRFGAAGRTLVIEEFLAGEEASFIVMCDGLRALPLASSQDHKTRDDGDRGPNTGGMGAYSPAPVVSGAVHARIMREVIEPTVAGLRDEGMPYTGFLYAGVMIGVDGAPKVLEFNCRLGDPETQPVMMRLGSDLVALCQSALDGRLDQARAEWDPRAAVGVVLAARGYPGEPAAGDPISGLEREPAEGVKVFHAATARRNGDIVTTGGRVLCVTALGESVLAAQQKAYQEVNHIQWEGMFCRRDIAWRAIRREAGENGATASFHPG